MKDYFSGSQILDCDCYVADYTESSCNRKGVVISLEPFSDISYFHLKKVNRNQSMPYLAVNLEEYENFIKGTQNCECIFSSMKDDGRSWLLFLETKYCDSGNIDRHAFKAYSQMWATMSKLVELHLIDLSRKRVYFVYSVPGHDDLSPFSNFVWTQNETLQKIQEAGVQPLPYNTVLIATPEYLFVPRR